jgi:hypothetical protein
MRVTGRKLRNRESPPRSGESAGMVGAAMSLALIFRGNVGDGNSYRRRNR